MTTPEEAVRDIRDRYREEGRQTGLAEASTAMAALHERAVVRVACGGPNGPACACTGACRIDLTTEAGQHAYLTAERSRLAARVAKESFVHGRYCRSKFFIVTKGAFDDCNCEAGDLHRAVLALLREGA